MSKDKIGERREAPQWNGEGNERQFIGWMSALLVIGLILIGLFIWLGYPG